MKEVKPDTLSTKTHEVHNYHLDLILDSIPSAVIYIARDFTYQYANETYASWFGMKPYQLLGRNMIAIVGEEVFNKVAPYIEKTLCGQPVAFSGELPYENGTRYVEITYTPDIKENGEILGFIALLNDVTEKKKTEKELKESEAEYRQLLDGLPVAVYSYDKSGVITGFNKAATELYGRHPDAGTDHRNMAWKIKDVNGTLVKSEEDPMAIAVNSSGAVVANEMVIERPDGTKRIITPYPKPFFNIAGEPIGGVNVLIDMTERKKVSDALKNSEAKYRQLIQSLPVALYTCDKDGYVDLYNEAAVELWGRAPIPGKDMWCGSWKVFEADGITPIPLDECPMAVTIKKCHSIKGREIIVEKPDGVRRNILPHPELIFDADGALSGAINMLIDITDRKSTEEKIARLAAIVHSSDDAIVSKTLDGIVTSWNDAAVNIFGYTPEEMIGQSITKVIPKDKLYEEEDIVERLRKGERVDHFESKRLTKDGRLIDISLTISPVKNPAGKIIGASKIARDITIQKKMDRIIRDTEERFRMAVESTHLGTWDYLPLEGLLTWSKECRKIYDVPEGVEIDFDFFSKHIFPEDVDYVNNAVAKSMDPNGDGNYDIQYRVLRYSDKKPRWIRAQGKVLFDAQKQPERFIGTVLDITEEKNHEQQLKSSVELFRNMADSTPAIIWITSPDGFCTYFNKQWYDLTGQSARSALGFGWLDALHTEERKSVEEKFHAATQNHLPFNYEFRVCTTSGQYRWMLGVGSPKFQDNGIFEGFVGSVTDIHERKLAEERLKESEERLRMSVKSTGMGTWEFHPQTKKLIWSDESKKIFGLAESAEPDYQLISAQNYYEDKEFIEEEVNKILNNPGAGAFEIQHRIMRLSDNQQRWIKIQGKVIFNEKNIAQRLIGTMMDITNEKNREQQLIDSVELFRTMANNVPAMIWMSGTDKFQDFFNNTWLEFTGRTIDQERNDGWLEGVHPEDVSRCREVYDESVKKEKGFSVEYRLRRNDGEYRWISDNSAPRYGQDGRFAGFISASMDIDDQKRFREKIMESELLFKTISNASPAALWMTDRDEKNVFVNDTWIKWTGLDFDTQINRGWLNSVVEEDQVPTIAKFKECFREKKYFNTEFRFRRTDGELRWGFTEGYPFYDINEHFAGYAGSVTDITEIKKLEQRKDDFIKMASHELKTPITSISGYVQLLSNIYQDIDDDKLQLSKSTVKSSLGTISKQVSKLTRLITELLDLSKIESGRLDLHKTEFDLAILVNEIAQDMRQVSSRHAIAVNLEMDGKIYGDRDRIAQVLINLLTNAVKYSPDTDEVEITLTGSADEAIIRVKDQGIGIDKNEHQKIFERFYRAEGKREQTFPGFGIGLFIASEIIQRHGGKIEVESEKGKGSTFIVTLPTNPGKNE